MKYLKVDLFILNNLKKMIEIGLKTTKFRKYVWTVSVYLQYS